MSATHPSLWYDESLLISIFDQNISTNSVLFYQNIDGMYESTVYFVDSSLNSISACTVILSICINIAYVEISSQCSIFSLFFVIKLNKCSTKCIKPFKKNSAAKQTKWFQNLVIAFYYTTLGMSGVQHECMSVSTTNQSILPKKRS